METIIFSATIGLILAVAFVGIGVIIGRGSKRVHKTTLRGCNNSSYVCDRAPIVPDNNLGEYHEPVDCGQNLELDPKAEEMTMRLQTMRALANRTEKETIDYAIECVAVRNMLERFFEERGI